MTYSWQTPEPEFEHELTEHKCPECETFLTQTIPSTMLVCTQGHGPYFLV